MPLQTDTTHSDSTFVLVSYNKIVKANQAFIEIKHRRFQVENYERLLENKDQVIADLSLANQINRSLNSENAIKIASLQIKANQYEDLYKDYKFELKKSKGRETLLKIGTPLITIGVGGLSFLGGWYLNRALH